MAISPKLILFSLLAAAASAICLALLFYYPKFANGRDHAVQFEEISERLENKGVDFLILSIPYAQRDGQEQDTKIKALRRKLSATAFFLGLKSKGTNYLDLRPQFKEINFDPRYFRDSIHLSKEGITYFGKAAAKQLHNHLADNKSLPTKIIVAGDCYSEDLVSGLKQNDSDTEYVAARAYGDGNRGIQVAFQFPETYLNDTDLVIWLRAETLMGYNPPPELDLSPLVSGEAAETKTFTTTSELPWDMLTFHEILASLEYPDAVAEIAANDSKGEPVILCAYAAIGRKQTTFEAIRQGDSIVANVQAINSYLAENPKEASAYYFRTEESLTIPRYWVHRWAKVGSSSSKIRSVRATQDPLSMPREPLNKR